MILVLIAANLITTLLGFNNYDFFQRHLFRVDKIKRDREYLRMLSSGFLHVNWSHFLFNMYSLYLFGEELIYQVGLFPFLLIYFGSLLAGNFLSLFVYRRNPQYQAVGASGAVMGVCFAAVSISPGMELGIIFLPFFLPAWMFLILFVGYSIRGVLKQNDNIGHEAHLGGGLMGLLIMLSMYPWLFYYNPLPIAVMLIPTSLFIIYLLFRQKLDAGSFKFPVRNNRDRDYEFNQRKNEHQREVNRILDKINDKGMESLTQEEKEFLKRK